MGTGGYGHKPSRFSWTLALIFAFVDFCIVAGLYIFTLTLGSGVFDDPLPGIHERVAAGLDWTFELLSLPMIAVSGLTWYGMLLNPLIHGFLGERIVFFYRHRGRPTHRG